MKNDSRPEIQNIIEKILLKHNIDPSAEWTAPQNLDNQLRNILNKTEEWVQI